MRELRVPGAVSCLGKGGWEPGKHGLSREERKAPGQLAQAPSFSSFSLWQRHPRLPRPLLSDKGLSQDLKEGVLEGSGNAGTFFQAETGTIPLGGSVNAVHEEERKERGKDGGGTGT